MLWTTLWAYPVFFLTGLAAGLIDSIAGGGGLISLPILLASGMPVPLALGTNKLQASVGSFSAAFHYSRHGVVSLRDARLGIVMTAIGALLGTFAVVRIAPDVLRFIVPFLLIGAAVYLFFLPERGFQGGHRRMGPILFYVALGILLGFYDGFFGPGVGSFWALAFVGLLGFDLTRATGYTKVMNCTSNVVSFLGFLMAGDVLFTVGLTMAAGQILGAQFGSRFVIDHGARVIRPVFIVVAVLTTAKILSNVLLP